MREHVLLFCLLGLVLTATIILVIAPGAVTWALALIERADAVARFEIALFGQPAKCEVAHTTPLKSGLQVQSFDLSQSFGARAVGPLLQRANLWRR